MARRGGRRWPARSAGRDRAARDRGRGRPPARAGLLPRAGPAVPGRRRRGRRPGRGIRPLRPAPAGPRPARRPPGQRAGHPGRRPPAAALGDGPAVIVPPGRLHTVPWALLPALADRAFSVAPSAGAWLRAQAAPPPGNRHVILARGPGLVTGGAEVPAVADLYDDATVLGGAQATAARVLSALDGAWLGHIAAHGSFRADSPLFSALHMHDGPLTVYDFEQLQRAPYRLILSSCDSGVLAPAGADELLGLVSSLLPLGTAGIIAGVVPLNDEAIVPVMTDLHRHLRAGQSLAESMYSVRQDIDGDLVQRAAAMSLLALGAG